MLFLHILVKSLSSFGNCSQWAFKDVAICGDLKGKISEDKKCVEINDFTGDLT